MIKSYQTSGGTVLSTNWKEVREKVGSLLPLSVWGCGVHSALLLWCAQDYEKERQAPAGQEFVDPRR